MYEIQDYYTKQFNHFLMCYKLYRKTHKSFVFHHLSDAIILANYLDDERNVNLIERAVLGENIVKKKCVSNDDKKAGSPFSSKEESEVDVRELLYTILYLEGVDINKLWAKFVEITPNVICFDKSDIFSRNVNDDYDIIGNPNIMRYPLVKPSLLKNRINMIDDEELKSRVMMRFNPELMKTYSKVRKRVDK